MPLSVAFSLFLYGFDNIYLMDLTFEINEPTAIDRHAISRRFSTAKRSAKTNGTNMQIVIMSASRQPITNSGNLVAICNSFKINKIKDKTTKPTTVKIPSKNTMPLRPSVTVTSEPENSSKK